MKSTNIKVAAVQPNDRSRSRSPTKRVRFQEKSQGEKSSDDKKSDGKQVCGACLIRTDTVSFVQAGNETTKVSPGTEEILKVRTTARPSLTYNDMKTLKGIMGEKMIDVLRDTGCTGVIVKQSLVSPELLTGKVHTCMIVDRSTLQLPEAKVSLDTH